MSSMGKMKILVVGINPSGNRKEEVKEDENFRTNFPADKMINGALTELDLIWKENYIFKDIIDKRMTNTTFKDLNDEEKLKLAEENIPNILKKVDEFEPDCILLLSKTDTWIFKGFSKFVSLLQKQIKIPIVRIHHPSPVARYKKFTIKGYAEYIKSRIKEEKCEWCERV